MRKQTSSATEIIFSNVVIIDKTNRNNAIYSDINDKLSDLKMTEFSINAQFDELGKAALWKNKN